MTGKGRGQATKTYIIYSLSRRGDPHIRDRQPGQEVLRSPNPMGIWLLIFPDVAVKNLTCSSAHTKNVTDGCMKADKVWVWKRYSVRSLGAASLSAHRCIAKNDFIFQLKIDGCELFRLPHPGV